MIPGFANNLDLRQSKKGMMTGNFVFYEDKNILVFFDFYGRTFNLNSIRFLTKEWNIEDGIKNIPKPDIISEDGTVKEKGDQILYSYLNDGNEEIVIFGSLASFMLNHYDEKLNTNKNDITDIIKKSIVRNNGKRYMLLHDDAAGDVLFYLEGKDENGNLKIKVLSNDPDNGNIILELNGKYKINQIDDDNNLLNQFTLDNTKDDEKFTITNKHGNKIEANKKGAIIETATIRIGKDETLKKILNDLITAIQQMTQTTPGGNTVSPPINNSSFVDIKSRLTDFMDVQ